MIPQTIFAQKYLRVVREYLEDLSKTINERSNRYQRNLDILKELINTGKTNGIHVETLNQVLLREINEIADSESRIVVDVGQSPEELRELIQSLRVLLKQGDEQGVDSHPALLDAFKAQFKSKFEQGILDIFMKRRIVKITCPEFNQKSQILDEYIENYMGLNNATPKPISFSKEAIKSYYHYIESKIHESVSEDESLLNEKIRDSIKIHNEKVFLYLDVVDSLSMFDSEVINPIQQYFGWLEEPKSEPIIEETFSEFKRTIRKKVITLAEQANSKVFPRMLEEKVNESRSRFHHIVVELNDSITDLNSQREQILMELAGANLLNYASFESVKDSEVFDLISALQEMKRIGDKSSISLKKFISERNIFGSIIKLQLDKDLDDSYIGIKKKIDSLQGIPSEELDQVVSYFIISVSSFIKELSISILSDLEKPIEDVRDCIRPTTETWIAELKKVRDSEKEYERQLKQDKINQLLGTVIQYKMPSRAVDLVFSKISSGFNRQ